MSKPRRAYATKLGAMHHGDSLDLLAHMADESVDLVLTSPPFALAHPKEYGNETERDYVEWFFRFVPDIHRVLRDTGSFVIDLGGAWLPGRPVKSLYQWRLLVDLVDQFDFRLAQDFYWFNTAKIPGPAPWVTVNRWRAKDSVNTVWWLSKTDHPKSNNRNVLAPYSKSMKRLLATGKYNDGVRPGGQKVGKKFAKNNGGAIPPNVLQIELDSADDTYSDGPTPNDAMLANYLAAGETDNILCISNTNSNDPYHQYCKANEIKRHPARFPDAVPEFFVKMLTDAGDLVVDPFGGSNVTGATSENLGRRWLSCELDMTYIAGSLGRFAPQDLTFTSAKLAGSGPRAQTDKSSAQT